MKKHIAIGIAEKMFDATCELWEFLRPAVDETYGQTDEAGNPYPTRKILEDYEYWYGISDDWDVNIFSQDDNVLHCDLYEVDDEGNTITEYWYDICNGGKRCSNEEIE
jgi:hypothetical protein